MALGVLIALSLLPLAGCSEPELKDVPDTSGWFHVKVPENWQTTTDSNIVALYDAEKVPETDAEARKVLSVFLLASAEQTETAAAEAIAALVDARAKNAGWQDLEASDPQKTEVGGREGMQVTVSAKDANGQPFEGSLTLVQTNGKEILVVAAAAPDVWSEQKSAVDDLFDHWFWHQRVEQGVEESATGEPAE
jgi:hypothetical protein